MKQSLFEYTNPSLLTTELSESVDEKTGQKQKNLYMKGICIQGNVRNHNQRIYPVTEIQNAVNTLSKLLEQGIPILGHADHPDDLQISIDRVSHSIVSMWMEGANGCGKLKILPTPMGNIVRAILESDVKLGVSSRGSGNVNESTGYVSDFEIITIDAVCTPSGPDCWPKPIYESLMNQKHGYKALEIAEELNTNPRVQKYLKEYVTNLFKELKLR